MSSNNYPACVSQNLLRTSSFGYIERTNILRHVLSTSSLKLVGMRAISGSASQLPGNLLPVS